jgi:hypothetical protein
MYSILVYTLVFVGGFSVMSIELLGGRVLAPYFGSSIYVWGSIITVFMLALSIGYLLGGRFSVDRPSMTRFGMIFALCAATVLPLVLWGAPLMDWIFLRMEDPRYGSLIAAVALFFVPTTCMGFISPYAVRLLVEDTDHSGQVAGKLYFVSTAGSALGTLLTSFYFVLWFEVDTILLALDGALAACAAAALAWGARRPAILGATA